MITYRSPICMGCKRHKKYTLTCKAFPKRIPDAILHSEHDHRKKYRDDKGIMFEPKDEKAAQYADELFET